MGVERVALAVVGAGLYFTLDLGWANLDILQCTAVVQLMMMLMLRLFQEYNRSLHWCEHNRLHPCRMNVL